MTSVLVFPFIVDILYIFFPLLVYFSVYIGMFSTLGGPYQPKLDFW